MKRPDDHPPRCSYWAGKICDAPPVLWIYLRRLATTMPYCREHGDLLLARGDSPRELRRDDERGACGTCGKVGFGGAPGSGHYCGCGV